MHGRPPGSTHPETSSGLCYVSLCINMHNVHVVVLAPCVCWHVLVCVCACMCRRFSVYAFGYICILCFVCVYAYYVCTYACSMYAQMCYVSLCGQALHEFDAMGDNGSRHLRSVRNRQKFLMDLITKWKQGKVCLLVGW